MANKDDQPKPALIEHLGIDYRPFDGDGRFKCLPTTGVLPGTFPIELTRAQARLMIKMLVLNGHSAHSENGGTLWVIITWLQRHKKPFRIQGQAGWGYYVELLQTVTGKSKKAEVSSQSDPMGEKRPIRTVWQGGPPWVNEGAV